MQFVSVFTRYCGKKHENGKSVKQNSDLGLQLTSSTSEGRFIEPKQSTSSKLSKEYNYVKMSMQYLTLQYYEIFPSLLMTIILMN